jgi:hypothetical protein
MLKQQRGPWKVDLSFDAAELHVRPRADLVWHPLTVACPCRPAESTADIRDGMGDAVGDVVSLPVFVHVALDGRPAPPTTLTAPPGSISGD